jgi:hypothetical protein
MNGKLTMDMKEEQQNILIGHMMNTMLNKHHAKIRCRYNDKNDIKDPEI